MQTEAAKYATRAIPQPRDDWTCMGMQLEGGEPNRANVRCRTLETSCLVRDSVDGWPTQA